ncbi:ABC transporter permease [Membranihabitans maritimus]|uniref:ABC transporter permease n=1 Tax=Membranihabitans maritimus TaxID=2904244 RepID=UPI001F356C74|nr:ABC transporter permease [Membranihabitans maritimus]
MIKHYLILFLRNIKKDKSTFLINLLGLSTGLACVLLIYLWVNEELVMDKFHKNHDRIYQVIEHLDFSDGIQTYLETSGPMAEFLAEEMPEVEYATSTIPPEWFGEHLLSVGNNTLKAVGQLVSKDYFKIFSYELIRGDKTEAMTDPNSIVLSRKLANSLFGSIENVIGKLVEFEQNRQFRVSGIFENVPSHSTVQFDFALSTEASKEIPPWTSLQTWNSSGPKVYILVKEGANIPNLTTKIEKVRKNRDENTIRTATLAPFAQLYLHGKYENGKLTGGRIQYVKLFSVIAMIILIIACINFMNLSTARASQRLQEIGVKKAIGAQRNSFIFQFINESVLMAFVALILATVLVWLFLPRFNTIVDKQLTLTLDMPFYITATSIVILTGILAGIYPALYLSKFNALTILREKIRSTSSESWTRKGLVVIQFSLSILFIISVVVVYKQIEFIQNQNMGYEQDQIVKVNIEGTLKDRLQTFISEAKKLPGIENASSTTHTMVGQNWSGTLDWEGKDPKNNTQFQIFGVDYGYIETMGMEIIAGHGFSREFGADSAGIIFNETAIRTMGIEDPIGKTVENGRAKIIGIVKDFHFKSLHDNAEPIFMVLMPEAVKYVMVRIEAGKERDALEALRTFYEDFNPDYPFEFEFLNENFQAQYASEQRVATLSRYFAGLAILISCLGLFGLAAHTARQRTKEIGIRKVLGASVGNVVALLSKDFIRLVLIAIVIATPIAWYAMNRWLQGFAYRIDLQWWILAAAGLVAVVIAMITVSGQSLRAAMADPVKSLRTE